MKLLDLDTLKSNVIECFKGPAVYFLFHEGELVYIGCTLNFVGRIGSHATGKHQKEFDSFSVIRVPDEIAPVNLERAYIKKYRPKLNNVPAYDHAIDEFGNTALDRAMMRIDEGETIAQAAQAEKLNIGAVRARHTRIRKQDEKDEFLLSYINAGQTQESLRANRDANIGIHSKGGRRRAQEVRIVKASQRQRNGRRKQQTLASMEQTRLFD